jgi:hypothetical protein
LINEFVKQNFIFEVLMSYLKGISPIEGKRILLGDYTCVELMGL